MLGPRRSSAMLLETRSEAAMLSNLGAKVAYPSFRMYLEEGTTDYCCNEKRERACQQHLDEIAPSTPPERGRQRCLVGNSCGDDSKEYPASDPPSPLVCAPEIRLALRQKRLGDDGAMGREPPTEDNENTCTEKKYRAGAPIGCGRERNCRRQGPRRSQNPPSPRWNWRVAMPRP